MDEYNVIEGNVPILVSAPHVYPHFRPGFTDEPKLGELYTKDLVLESAEALHAFSIYATSEQRLDPNWYENSPYRLKVITLVEENNIRLFLDFHGLSYERPGDIEIQVNEGDAEGMILASRIVGKLEKDFENVAIKKFKNNDQVTLSEAIFQKFKIPSIQFEINLKHRRSKLIREQIIRSTVSSINENEG